MAHPGGHGSHPARTGWLNAGATLVAGVIGAVATLLVARSGNLPSVVALPTTTITVTQTALSTTTETVTRTVTPTIGSNTGTGVAATGNSGRTYLVDLQPVDSSLEQRVVDFSDVTYPNSLINLMSGCSQTGPVDYLVPGGATQLVAEVGVTRDSLEPDSRVTFQVTVDGQRAEPITAQVAQHATLRVVVSSKSRVRLETSIDKNRRTNCNTEAVAVWGDPYFS